MTIKTDLLDLRYACSAIGVEHEPEQPGHDVIELRAGLRISEFGALRARLDLFIGTTGAHLAPGGLCVLVAPFALPAQVGFAGATIKPAMGDQFSICLYG